MKNRVIVSSCAAAMLSLGIAAAQTTTQTPTQSPVQGTTQGTPGQSRPTAGVTNEKPITVTGCVMRETDYTKERGGALNTGIGAGNEYVLANAMTGAARSAADPSSRSDAASGVSGSTSSGREPASVGTSGAGSTSSGAGNPDAASGADRPRSTAGQTEPDGTSRQDSTASRSTTSGTAYMLTGPREGDLSAHVGKRVEITGTIEDDARPTGTSGQARSGAAEMQEIRITSFREVPGTCQ